MNKLPTVVIVRIAALVVVLTCLGGTLLGNAASGAGFLVRLAALLAGNATL